MLKVLGNDLELGLTLCSVELPRFQSNGQRGDPMNSNTTNPVSFHSDEIFAGGKEDCIMLIMETVLFSN